MKIIRTLAFQGTGAKYAYLLDPNNDLLLYVGHVSHEFVADEPGVFYGFHPSQQTINAEGGPRAVRLKFKRHEPIPAIIQNDTPVFHRAYELNRSHTSELDERLLIYGLAVEFEDEDYEVIRTQYMTCYNENNAMSYGWPPITQDSDYDNCVTVQRKFGMPVIQLDWHRGEMSYFMQILREYGQIWTPDTDQGVL